MIALEDTEGGVGGTNSGYAGGAGAIAPCPILLCENPDGPGAGIGYTGSQHSRSGNSLPAVNGVIRHNVTSTLIALEYGRFVM
jgi:hypothetical protein